MGCAGAGAVRLHPSALRPFTPSLVVRGLRQGRVLRKVVRTEHLCCGPWPTAILRAALDGIKAVPGNRAGRARQSQAGGSTGGFMRSLAVTTTPLRGFMPISMLNRWR